ncbi:MAG TPA: hypothetical protein VGD62_08085 [Acidobacteriaceae bacterium]
MSVFTTGLNMLENRLPKVIDARTHGLIDYGHAAFFLGMAFFCRKSNPRAATAALATGAFVLTQSLLTDYPLGVTPVLSFEQHGKLDAGFAASSLALPRLFGFEDTGAAKIFKANAFVEATVVGLTDFSNQHAQAEKAA